MDILNTKIKNILTEKTLKIRPENIKKDVTAFGITGTYTGEIHTLQSKSVTITENGTTTITPDSGYDGLDEVEVTTNVSGGQSEYNAKINTIINTSYNGVLFNIAKLPVFTFTSTDANNLFNNFRALEECPNIDLSKVTSMSGTFNYCNKLTFIPTTLNTSNVTSMEGLCIYCTSLVTFPNLDVSENTNFFRAFDNCTSLVNFPQLNIPKVTNMKNMFRACDSLSNESLNNILGMLASATSYTTTKTLYFIGLSKAQATTCTTLSNWAAAQSAGWTTGY